MPYTFDHDTFEGRRPNAECDPLIGTMLDDRYLIEDKLATGGFGAIYRARTARGEAVALKILHPRLTADPTMVARFRREGATLTRLHDPHTVTTLAVGESRDGMLYIAMELLSGESLRDHLHRAGALPWQSAVAIARAVCSSLAEAHGLGVVHRDLKPANIHVETRGGALHAVKVIDFGIAKIVRGSSIDDGNELTWAGHMIGTYDYMSPEQLLGAGCSSASDLYSLGVVTYEMLTGRRPYPKVTSPASMITAIVTQVAMRPSVLAAIPPELDRLVMRCLEREPSARFRDVVELARELERLLALRAAPLDEITVTHPAWHTVRDDRAWGEAAIAPIAPIAPEMRSTARGSRPRHGTLPGVAVATDRHGDERTWPEPERPRPEPSWPEPERPRPERAWLELAPATSATPAEAAPAMRPTTAERALAMLATPGEHAPPLPPLQPWLLPPLVPPGPPGPPRLPGPPRRRSSQPAPPPPRTNALWWIAVAILVVSAIASAVLLLLDGRG